jgi:hypothetical protein
MKVKGFVSTTIGTLMHAGMESFDTSKFPDPDAYLEDKAKDFASFIGLLYGYSKMNDTDEVTFNVDGENISITVKDFKENTLYNDDKRYAAPRVFGLLVKG